MRREVTRAADFLPHLAASAGSHAHNSADGIAAACLPYQLESNPRIAIAAVVPEKHGRAAIRDPQKIGVAVVVEVAGSKRPADIRLLESIPVRRALFQEAVTDVVEEKRPFGEGHCLVK